MDDLTKALGPWPVLQFTLGAIIFLMSAYMVFRGVMGAKNNPPPMMPAGSTEEERARWRVYEAIENMEEQIFKIAEQQRVEIELLRQVVNVLSQTNETFRRLHDALWNRSQP